jgi:hypothetical protein
MSITFGAETEFYTANAVYNSAATLSATTFVVAYRKPYPSHAAARVGTVSGTDITFGAATEFVGDDGCNGISVTALSATAFVAAYGDGGFAYGAAKVGTVSGTSITFGTEAAFQSNFTGADFISATALSATAFVVAYRDISDPLYGHGRARVGSISGTSITFGAATEFVSANGASRISVAALSATAFVVAYRDYANPSVAGMARIGTVSGMGITFGAAAEFESAGVENISAAALDADRFVVAYSESDASYHGTAKVGTVSGTAITFGAAAEFLSGYVDSIAAAAWSATTFVVACQDLVDSARGKAWNGTVSGTAITFGAETEFLAAGGGADFNSITTLSGTQFVIAYRDNSDSGHGTAKVGSLSSAWATGPSDSVSAADSSARAAGKATSDSVSAADSSARAAGKATSDSVAIADEATVAYSHAVAVASDPSGVPMSASPNDEDDEGNGTTPFSRRYADSAGINITAPAKSGNRVFLEWRDGGGNTLSSSRALVATVDGVKAYTAHYEFAGDSADDYLVASP